MQEARRQFNAEHDEHHGQVEHDPVGRLLPAACPRPCRPARAPTSASCTSTSWPTHAARNIIVPLDDLAKAIGLTDDDFTPTSGTPASTRTSGTASRSTSTRSAMYYNKDHFAEGRHHRAADRRGRRSWRRWTKLKKAGFAGRFWMPPLWPATCMYLSLMWQAGGEPYGDGRPEGRPTTPTPASTALEWQRSMVDKGYSPPNVAIDSQYVGVQERQERPSPGTASGRSTTWRRDKVNYGIAPIPQIFDKQAVWANSHHFFISTQAAKDKNKLAGQQGVHRLDERALGRLGRLRA